MLGENGYMKTDGELIFELKNRVSELERQIHVLEAFVENSTDAIQISDRNLITIRINKAYEVLTGIKREELIGIPVDDLVKKHLISESCGAIVAKTKKPHTIVQTFYRTGRSAHVSCTPVFDQKGEIEFFVCNDRDLDEISNLQVTLHETNVLKEKYLSELETLKSTIMKSNEIVAKDPKMLKVLALANRVAKVDSTALILGETGVGKDEVARFIHQNSSRAEQVFVPVNCGAIAESLFESELFGHESHAFTGAGGKSKAGLLEAADHGTLFLDEIGELPLNMQAKLLRVIQEQSFIRVGGNKPVRVDVRIIAATNQNLEEMVKEKKFREDLYYRLSVVPIYIPPLRERKEDIIPLAQHFLNQYNKKYGKKKCFAGLTLFDLSNQQWTGNVRQLKNIVELSYIMADTDIIGPENLPIDIKKDNYQQDFQNLNGKTLKEILESIELNYLDECYRKFGNIRDAASFLKIPATTFLRHYKQLSTKYNIQDDAKHSPEVPEGQQLN